MTSLVVTHEYRVVTEGLVNVFITSNCNSFQSEKKFSKDLTVNDLKNKLELITGASALSMTITAFDKKDTKVCDSPTSIMCTVTRYEEKLKGKK